MSRNICRSHAARAVVLLMVVAAALSWAQFGPSPSRAPAPSLPPDAALAPAAADAAAVQTVLPGVALAPVTKPAPQVQPTRHHKVGKKHAHRRSSRARHRHHHHRRHHHRSHPRHHRSHHASHRSHHGSHHRSHHASHPSHPSHHRSHHASHHRSHHRTHRTKAVRRAPNPWLSSGGRDIGWPQCPHDVGFRGRNGLGQPMPDAGVEFVIIGLTNGRSFTPNPCLDRHLGWVRTHHVQASAYAFATYPTRGQLRRLQHSGPYNGRRLVGALANVGHATARYNVRTMQAHGFTTPHVWLDVEPSSSRPWSHNRARNRAVVRGWVRGYRDAGYTVGFYSTTALWDGILGGRFRTGLPEWRTAGPVRPRSALSKCSGESIQGGPPVIAQWWTDHRDFDRICPGPSRSDTMARYFHQW